MKETYYSIGEVAKMTNISIQTLRYYDQLDLFKPAYVDPSTNYRYYTDAQFYYLDIIKSLKYIGVSLDEIKAAQSFTPQQLLEFLQQQEHVIEQRMSRLQEVQQTLYKTKKQMQEQLAINILNTVYVKSEEASRILSIRTNDLIPSDIPNIYYSSLMKTLETENSFLSSRYGCIYPLKQYESLDQLFYSHIFTPLLTDRYITHLTSDMDVQVIPKGQYVCIAFIYSPAAYFVHYQKLYQYIVDFQLQTADTVYEIFMPLNYSPSQKDEFIVELKVQLV